MVIILGILFLEMHFYNWKKIEFWEPVIEFHIIALYRFPIYLNQYYYKLSLFRARITSVFTKYVFIFPPKIIHIYIHLVFNV